MKIGERIKEIRVAKGMTQLELAEKSGVALRTVQRIENNEVTPSFYSLNAIGEALDIKLNADVFIETDNKFEFKIVISNFSNLFADIGTLIKRNMKTLLVLITLAFGFLSYEDLKLLFVNIDSLVFTEDSRLTSVCLDSVYYNPKIDIKYLYMQLI
jgi:transcriptional regulator with XRE-family HTH domain